MSLYASKLHDIQCLRFVISSLEAFFFSSETSADPDETLHMRRLVWICAGRGSKRGLGGGLAGWSCRGGSGARVYLHHVNKSVEWTSGRPHSETGACLQRFILVFLVPIEAVPTGTTVCISAGKYELSFKIAYGKIYVSVRNVCSNDH